jgi:hypothetical protein
MVSNRVGPPVRGEDFFGRDLEQQHCWDLLDRDHLLLLAPRRVGKTSLMERLKETASGHGFEAVYLSGADAEDEAAFVQRLCESATELSAWEKVSQALSESFLVKALKRVQKVGVGVASLELTPAAKENWAILGEKLARVLDQQEGRWLFLVDEIPVFLLTLLRLDSSGERARRFLTWFRSLRQRSDHEGRVRWLLAGSIGLDTVTARLSLGDTINDLHIYHLGAFSPETANRFLVELSKTHSLLLADGVRAHIVERVGWPIPYYLQLVFSELRGRFLGTPESPSTAGVDLVFEDLLKPAKKAYFDYWRQRLSEELGAPDARLAQFLLNAVAVDPNGCTRGALRQQLGKKVRSAAERDEKLRYLLDTLESDGYLVEHDGRFVFRSPLLREFWVRRVLP